MNFCKIFGVFIAVSFFLARSVLAQVVLNEVMYNPVGNDTGREWIELYNSGSDTVTMVSGTKGWKLNDGSNHVLVDPASGIGRGTLSILPGNYLIILNNDSISDFVSEYPGGSYSIIKSAFSLKNSGDTLVISLLDDSGNIVDTLNYVSEASGKIAYEDGNSLQLVGGILKAQIPTPGKANSDGAAGQDGSGQVENSTSTPSDNSGSEDTSGNQTNSSQGNVSNWPVEPQIISRIVGSGLAISGADISLKGEALGLDNKPIKNPRYLWNFGDGSVKEGENVLHAYNFPGEYVVILEVSSGIFEGSSRLKVKVIPADISIEGVLAGINGKVELVNNTKQELDLSWWRIKSGLNFFTLPKNTKILPAGRLPLSAVVMGFPVDENELALLYPNGVLMKKFEIGNQGSIAYAPSAVVSNKVAKVSESAKVAEISTLSTEAKTQVVSKKAESLPQTASVAASVDSRSTDTDQSVHGGKSNFSFWLYGVCGIIILAIGFVLVPKPPDVPKNTADDYKIIED